MPEISLRKAHPKDFDRIVEINALEVVHTSAMDRDRLDELDSYSFYHSVVEVDGVVAAFLLAMRDGSDYVNDNFGWFADRYESFLYIDRIVVNADFNGLKLGSLLYKDIFEFAKKESINVICCEYNLIPSNIPSQKFHDKFGFSQVGEQWLDNKAKKVSLQMAKT